MIMAIVSGLLLSFALLGQSTPALKDVKKIFIEKFNNDLDQYLRVEFTKQMKGRVAVTLDADEADAILTGVSENKTGVGAAVTGRYLGLHDNATAAISLLAKDRKTILWAGEAGDRSLMFGVMTRGGPRKVADRIVSRLKKAIQEAR